MVDFGIPGGVYLDDLALGVNEDFIDSNLPAEDPPLVPPPNDESDWTSSPAGKEFRSSFLFQSSCYLPGDDDATESETSCSHHLLSPLSRYGLSLRPQTSSSEDDAPSSSWKPTDSYFGRIDDGRRHVVFCDELRYEGDDKKEKALDDTDCGDSSSTPVAQSGFRIAVPLHRAFGSLPPVPLTHKEEMYDDAVKDDDLTAGVHSRTGVSTLTYNNEAFPLSLRLFPKSRRLKFLCGSSLLFIVGILCIVLACGVQECRRTPENVPSPSLSPPNSPLFDGSPSRAPTTYVLKSTPELYDAVDLYLLRRFGSANSSDAGYAIDDTVDKGSIGRWDVSGVSNFTSVFDVQRNPLALYFNEDLQLWDTSNSITMERMFFGAKQFNGDISTWNTSNVVNMKEMFAFALDFDGDVSVWDVSRVTSMESMFRRTRVFNRNLRRWNTSSVLSMSKMFLDSYYFTGEGLDAWDTSSVTDMSLMFRYTPSFNGDLSNWNVSKVRSMRSMFQEAIAFNSDLSNWDLSNVVDISLMFMHAVRFKADVSPWQTSSIRNASQTFFGAFSFNVDVSQWDVRSLLDLTKMFAGAINFKHDLCSWEGILSSEGKLRTRSIFVATSCPERIYPPTNMSDEISFCFPCGYSSLGTTNATDGNNIFDNTNETAPAHEYLIGSEDPIPFLSSEELFAAVDDYLSNNSNTSEVARKYGYPIGSWNVSQILDFSRMFDADRNPLTSTFSEDLSYWDTSSAQSMSRMFAGASVFNGNVSMWSTSRVESMDSMFLNAYSFNGDLTNWDTSSCTNMASMFQGADLFNGKMFSFDTSNVVNMSAMFSSAISFEGWGLEKWDTAKVRKMKALFSETFSFKKNVLSSWDVSKVVDMSEIFQFSSFNGNISDWNVANVRSFEYAFSGAGSFNHNLSPWNVSQVRNFDGMFTGAKGFNQDLCDWVLHINSTVGVTSSGMFVSTACLNTNDPNLGGSGPVESMCSDCIFA